MTDAQVADQAFTLSEMASDDSVTMSVLAGREGRYAEMRPLNEPPVTYLAETEAPVYVLTNGKRGVGLGTKGNTVSPDGDRRTVILITGRRTLCLVGKRETDEVVEVPHDSIASVSYSRGLRKHRLVLQTPGSAYHCWVHRKTGTQLLDNVIEFVDGQRPEEPTTVEDDRASRITYRGRPVRSDANAVPGRADDGGSADASVENDDDNGIDETATLTYRGQSYEKT
jgi:hypothetical protein